MFNTVFLLKVVNPKAGWQYFSSSYNLALICTYEHHPVIPSVVKSETSLYRLFPVEEQFYKYVQNTGQKTLMSEDVVNPGTLSTLYLFNKYSVSLILLKIYLLLALFTQDIFLVLPLLESLNPSFTLRSSKCLTFMFQHEMCFSIYLFKDKK